MSVNSIIWNSSSKSVACIPAIILAVLPIFFFFFNENHANNPLSASICSRLYEPQSYLNVLTLIYGQKMDHVNIAHNCRMISSTRHKFFIYTDDISQPYCKLCTCVRFRSFQCPCPRGPDGCRNGNLCEKLEFLIQSINDYGSFLFLDNDLLVVKQQFLDHMFYRSRAHDFLASYGHGNVNTGEYLRNINSGLMFIRRLAHVNYGKMRDMMYKRKAEQDQGVVSDFFQKQYSNWDTLSWKWLCRALKRSNQDIPPEECYTIHDRHENDELLHKLNYTRLTVP